MSICDCWPWGGAISSTGYGTITVARKTRLVHRYIYELMVGPIPPGLELDHLCRAKLCFNPAHLEPVTHQENIRRARRTHCQRGHAMTPDNLYMRPDGRGHTCKTCDRLRQRLSYRTAR